MAELELSIGMIWLYLLALDWYETSDELDRFDREGVFVSGWSAPRVFNVRIVGFQHCCLLQIPPKFA